MCMAITDGHVIAECRLLCQLVEPPLSSQSATFAVYIQYIHFVPAHPPGVLVRAIWAASHVSVWMPWLSSPTLGPPLVPVTLLFPP